jgi:hypothetical protein
MFSIVFYLLLYLNGAYTMFYVAVLTFVFFEKSIKYVFYPYKIIKFGFDSYKKRYLVLGFLQINQTNLGCKPTIVATMSRR